ncbi:hypothetical protein E4T56_gene8276 [Termitomyces sp. T112]|nr:hypothetical protein E4T56_gene8276 [Termitomyces sp. T112]
MPPPTSFHKPSTAPYATIAVILPSPNKPPNYVALCNGTVKRNGAGIIIVILHYPPFTSAIVGTWSMAQMLLSSADQAHYLGLLNLANFACIANQSGFSGLLSDALRLPSSAWDVSARAKAFCSFANAIVTINNNHQKLHCKHEAEAKCQAQDHDVAMAGSSPAPSAKHKANTEIDGKHKPKKVKVTSSVTNYKLSSETALLLSGQVNAILKAVFLADSNELVPHKDLKKQYEAVELAAQQQLHLLNLSLQIYKLIAACLTCLDKVLASPDVELTGSPLDALNVSFKMCLFLSHYFYIPPLITHSALQSTPEESDIKLTTSPIDEPRSSLELLSTPTL